jgi:hypothetical protein
MSNPKKIDLAALLQDDDAPTILPICHELERGNFAQPDGEFCAEHTGKQAVEAGRFPARKNGFAGVSPCKQAVANG